MVGWWRMTGFSTALVWFLMVGEELQATDLWQYLSL